jgi:hypothetical protein
MQGGEAHARWLSQFPKPSDYGGTPETISREGNEPVDESEPAEATRWLTRGDTVMQREGGERPGQPPFKEVIHRG